MAQAHAPVRLMVVDDHTLFRNGLASLLKQYDDVQLVADANVLLSAVIGGRAAIALRHDKVDQVFTPAVAYDEVFEYLRSSRSVGIRRMNHQIKPAAVAESNSREVTHIARR